MNDDEEVKNYIGAIIKLSNQMYIESPVTDKDDLMQAGFIGMLSGLESYSEEKAIEAGAKKTTYVIQCIRNSILQEANKFFGATTLPHNKRLKFNAFKRLKGQDKDKETIKDVLLITDEEYDEFVSFMTLKHVVNIESLAEKDSHSIVKEDENSKLDDIIDIDFFKSFGLPEEDIKILQFKLNGITYNEIAEYYNVSRETMRKRIHKILLKIKESYIK
jgi:RNA polymerase sigma factor (sigma-70 family)